MKIKKKKKITNKANRKRLVKIKKTKSIIRMSKEELDKFLRELAAI